MPEIACIGILVADLIGRPIDSLPEKGRLGLVDHMSLHIGGCAANTGIDLARLGVDTAIIAKVGADGLGRFMHQTLESEGIDTRGLVQDGGVNSSASMVLVDGSGERTFLHYLGVNATFQDTDVSWNIVDESKYVHIAGALVMPAFDGKPMSDCLKRAQKMGKTTSMDVVWDATGRWMKTLGLTLPFLDYFMPSLAEGREITGRHSVQDVAASLRDAGVATVVLKNGENGCFVASPDGNFESPAFRVVGVDGTGSGDAFDAGFLCGLTHGWDLEKTARFANAVGALCVKEVGSTTGIRSFEETEMFVREYHKASN